MKKYLIVILILTAAGLARAQAPASSATPVDGAVPAPSNVATVHYLRINPTTATFRILRPARKSESCSACWVLQLRSRQRRRGVVTTKPSILASTTTQLSSTASAAAIPARKPFTFQSVGKRSEVPGDESDIFAIKGWQPHGTLREQWYYSKATNPPAWRHIRLHRRPATRRSLLDIRFCISSTVPVRTKQVGRTRVTRISSWIT